MEKQKIFFENLKRIKDYWVNKGINDLEPNADLRLSDVKEDIQELQKLITTQEKKDALKRVLNNIIEGVFHSTLVMIDGGDALADRMKIDLVDFDTGESLKGNTALHEEFFGYLLDNE
ncbi:MAG TPA: hypothetical protein PKA10_10140 [Selenomonadales bacterium]|nr:hypothetical protein [Selenomonadales bacterium]